MDEKICQIAEQIAQLHQKAYTVYLPLVEDVCNRSVSEGICIYILAALRFILKHIGRCGERRIVMVKMVKETIHAKGIDIGIYTTNFKNEFISLTILQNIEMRMPRDL